MSQHSDRDWLFGLLAVRMGLVDAEDLRAAAQTRTDADTDPLGETLIRQGALDEEERSLIETVIQKHEHKHSGDLRRCCDSLSSTVMMSQGTTSLGDVTRLADKAPGSDVSVGDVPRQGSIGDASRYAILQPHAQGGLGEVFVARDLELDRDVALKLIRSSHAHDSESRRRFTLEAEVTGRLEHPNIVPVYGKGQYEDGRPCYAMRFIRGAPFAQAIAQFHKDDEDPQRDAGERSLAFRRLLRQFIEACNAVGYAHSHGVLHRDIKPDNIMLGTHGETLVVDWGLAKQLERKEGEGPDREEGSTAEDSSVRSATLLGTAIGTPQFMSPEQALGWHDTLTFASDVYSLGATLYVLLTGRQPFEADSTVDLLSKVIAGTFPTPRESNAKVPRALEAICLKAMALKSKDRYATPEALADDVEHWLADEPVTAYREPWRERLARTVSRSHHDVQFHTWGSMLLVFAVLLLLTEVAVFVLNDRLSPPSRNLWYLIVRGVQYASMAVVFLRNRPKSLLPTSAAERGMWSVWFGFLLACHVVGPVEVFLASDEAPFELTSMYPAFAMLSGLAFFALGSGYWGRCFVHGVAFFALAFVMTWNMRLAPLWFGIAWAVCCVDIGMHLRRMASPSS